MKDRDWGDVGLSDVPDYQEVLKSGYICMYDVYILYKIFGNAVCKLLS
jgi:hypothetical protein